jgi:hypothetical protein
MAIRTHSHSGSWTRGRLVQAGVGVGVFAPVLATAAVATAAPQAPAVHTPAQVSVARVPAKPYSSVTVSPGIVRAGTKVTISGNAPKNARAGKTITLMSDAFATKHTISGIPSIRTQVLVNGKYSATATIRHGLKPTTYAVMGTFNGKALDTVAWIKVR